MELSLKMKQFGKDVFTELEEKKEKMIQQGHMVYDLSAGTPDQQAPAAVIEALQRSAGQAETWKYAFFDLPELVGAVTEYYRKRFGVALCPSMVTSCNGAQLGLFRVFAALCNPSDEVLLPDPYYPGFLTAAHEAQTTIRYYPLTKENGFLPDLRAIPEDVARRAKLMVVNFPSNPVGSVVPEGFHEELVSWAREYDVFIVYDNVYCELFLEGETGRSFLQAEGAKDVGVELFSFSKTYYMTGARLGFVIGNEKVVSAVRTLRENMDVGIFLPLQKAAVAALSLPASHAEKLRGIYRERRDIFCDGLRKIGWNVENPKGAFYVWCPLPEGDGDSIKFCDSLLERAGVLGVPGSFFGAHGEGYVRFALVKEANVLKQIVSRIGDAL